jgi:hypothetical protein
MFVTQLYSKVGLSVWQIVWVMTNCYFMSNILLPWIDIPNTPQNNYLACNISGPPINVQAIAHESGENQNLLPSLGYLLEILVKTYHHLFRKIPLQIFKLRKYLPGQNNHTTGLCDYYQVLWEISYFVKNFQICFKMYIHTKCPTRSNTSILILLQDHSTCYGYFPYPSSGVQ